MIGLRNVATLGLLIVVAGSCSNDFDQFDFKGDGEGEPGTGGSAYYPGNTGATTSTNPRGAGGSTSGGGKSGATGGKGDGSAGRLVGTAGMANPNGGRPGDGGPPGGPPPAGGGRAQDGGPPGGAGRAMGMGMGAGGTTSGGTTNGGMGKAGSSQAGSGGIAGAASCPKDQAKCGASCVQLTTPDHCGSCANVCAVGFACMKGACACSRDDDCAPNGAGANGANGEGGEAGAAGASSAGIACNLGACVCGGTRCAAGERCQSDGSCGVSRTRP